MKLIRLQKRNFDIFCQILVEIGQSHICKIFATCRRINLSDFSIPKSFRHTLATFGKWGKRNWAKMSFSDHSSVYVYMSIYIFVYMFGIDWRNCKSHKADFWQRRVFYGYLGHVQVSEQNVNSSRSYDVIVTFFPNRKIGFSAITRPLFVIEGWNFNRMYKIIVHTRWHDHISKVMNHHL